MGWRRGSVIGMGWNCLGSSVGGATVIGSAGESEQRVMLSAGDGDGDAGEGSLSCGTAGGADTVADLLGEAVPRLLPHPLLPAQASQSS